MGDSSERAPVGVSLALTNDSVRLYNSALSYSAEVDRTELTSREIDAIGAGLGMSLLPGVSLLRSGLWRRIDVDLIDVAANM